jgi:predicted ATPase
MKLFFSLEKPFCIFIDDLQWVDDITINWIENILINLKNTYIFVAYRDDEVNKNHRVSKMFSKVDIFNVEIKKFKINDLSKKDMQ